MAVVTLAERIEAPADAVWDYVCWHGVAKLDQYSGGFFRKIEFQGDEPKVGRNDPCPCGSGKKYKKCHGAGAA